MAASSHDQNGDVSASQRPRAGKRRFGIALLINIIIFLIVAVIILVLLVHLNVIPSQWYTPLVGILGPAFVGIAGFVKTTLADKDFQEALRKRLTQLVAGDGEKGSNDEKTAKDGVATSQPTININITNTNTNANTNSSTPLLTDKSTAGAQPEPATQQHQPNTAETTTKASHAGSVFLVGAPLPNPHEFYGRVGERMTLFNRTNKGYSTSLVGPRRIGKTWLISFLRLQLADQFGAHFRIGYIDATRPRCSSVAGFTACALEAWDIPVPGTMHAHLDLTTLEETVKDLRAKQLTPVLCIDEFEHFGNSAVFDLSFFTSLRSLTGPGLELCLVVASKTPLIDIVGDIGKTSGFFNVFEQLTLNPFDVAEAEEFVQGKGAQADFTEQECDYLRTYGREYTTDGPQWPPLRLQLVGEMLEQDKRLAASHHPRHYRPTDVTYWKDFEQRLTEKYRGMVKA